MAGKKARPAGKTTQMAIEYINRRSDIYYLHEGKTKRGNPRFYFSKSKNGNLAESIPEGYEIYENPRSQVFLRKVSPNIFTDKEIALIKEGAKKYEKLKYYIVDIKKNAIAVCLPDQNIDSLVKTFSEISFMSSGQIEERVAARSTYSPELRFVLVNKKERLFRVDRWCWRGSIDDWIELELSTDLLYLVKKYCFHLGKDSFFELF